MPSAIVALGPTSGPSSTLTFFNDAVTTPVQIKATVGQIYLLDLINGAAATSYLQLFWKPITAVVLGTTVPDMVIKLPTNAGSGFAKTIAFVVPVGYPFGAAVTKSNPAGLTVAGTTTPTGATTAAISVTAQYV